MTVCLEKFAPLGHLLCERTSGQHREERAHLDNLENECAVPYIITAPRRSIRDLACQIYKTKSKKGVHE